MCPGFNASPANTMDLSMAACNAEKATMKSTEYRKVIKPLLERRRRARINSCLDELKALILENAQNENTDASKLEKADILELTVQHLRSLRQSSRHWPVAKPALKSAQADKFRAGFAECAHEVSTYIAGLGAVESETKSRLLTHLAHCINRIPVLPAAPPMACCAATPGDGLHLRGVHLTTPTPPPSPMSPLQSCRTSADYVVPVSPISPAPYSDYAGQYAPHDDPYAWTDTASSRCSISRSSYESSPRYDERSCRSPAKILVSSRPKTPAGLEHYASKPWRPW